MEENICKQWDRKGIDLQNLQTAQAAQYIYIFRKKYKPNSPESILLLALRPWTMTHLP